jgi:hypothetical protein
MNTTNSKRKFLWITVLAVAVAGGFTLWAGEKPATRPPLKLMVDTKPIDRANSARVSYSVAVKKPHPA